MVSITVRESYGAKSDKLIVFLIFTDMPLQTTTQSQSVSMLLSTNNLPSDQQTSHLSDCDDLIIVDSPAEVEPSCGPSFGLFLEDRKPELLCSLRVSDEAYL